MLIQLGLRSLKFRCMGISREGMMKNLLGVLIVICSLFSSAQIHAGTVYFLGEGDSIANGYNGDGGACTTPDPGGTNYQGGFWPYLATDLGGSPAWYNAGADGDTSAGVLSSLSSTLSSYPCTRFYIHARNVAAALLFLTDDFKSGDKYNIVGEKEVSNLEMAKFIHSVVSEYVPVPTLNYEMVDFHSSRPGHDLRYALDGTKMHDMGFDYPRTFEASLRKTVEWTLRNRKWLMIEG